VMKAHCQQSRMAFVTLALFVGALTVVTGCNNPFATTEGKVTFDGQPVQEGAISFESADGQGPTAGCGIQNGEYRIERIVPGKKIVRITAQRKTGKRVPLSQIMPPGMAPAGAMTDEIESYIPAYYNDNSELTAEIGSGSNSRNFELKRR
jgi:hypothetical protein